MSSRADELQRLAASPQASVWVAASAGTGKTKVLTDRVLNLLLEGALPQRILCLTFTRAAAGEMQNRLNQRLSQWVLLSEEELEQQLTIFLGIKPSAEQRQRARHLFPVVLDTPGGMKIQTIHGFCQSILKRFPLEAKLTPHFQVIDENQSNHLLQQVQNDLLRSDQLVRPFLQQLTDVFDDISFAEMLNNLMAERHKWSWLLEGAHAFSQARFELEKVLGISLEETISNLKLNACNNAAFAFKDLKEVVEILQMGSSSDQERARVIAEWLELPEQRVKFFAQYISQFLTADGEVRKRLVTKKISDVSPHASDILIQEADRLQRVQEKLNAVTCAHRSWAIIQIGVAVLDSYIKEKQRRGFVDYDDLIERTAKLLRQPEIAPWVLYKLDGGLDHILVDEAQDTNIHQWTVISALAEEFFSGDSARVENRTLFVVGDAKQSIYSFQGANPFVFDEMRQYFTRAAKSVSSNWREVKLNISFRSTQAVLEAVDKVFQREHVRDGVAIQEEIIEHQSFRRGQGGIVEIWPLVTPEEDEAVLAWAPPLAVQDQIASPQVRLANLMAAQIRHWLDNSELLMSQGRPIKAGDIMVLVRRRSDFVDALVGALKQAGVPVAGSDRMQLLNHLAVQDLVALGKFVLQPLDDLNLACLLKGPFLNLTEEELFSLAYNRGEKSLWAYLQEQKDQFHKAYLFLQEIHSRGQKMTPFEFYARLLGELGGRKALVARLGYESLDPIDEFLHVVQQYQQTNLPSLLGFLTWLSMGDVEIKRDLDQRDQDEVRIMTVHGAKGLQSPIVFLPDTVQIPRFTDRILWTTLEDQAGLPIWSPSQAKGCSATDRLKQQAQYLMDQEYRRLLYVALTRAEDRLYICGWKTQQEVTEQSWYHLVETALRDLGQPIEYDFAKIRSDGWQGAGWRHSCPQVVEVKSTIRDTPFSVVKTQPEWLFKKPLQEVSMLHERPSQGPEPIELPEQIFERGRIIHKLLQYLPEVPCEQREEVGLKLLKTMPEVSPDQYRPLLADVLRVLRDEKLKEIFSPTSRAEVPITAQIDGKVVLGQIDRLLVSEREVIIIDYKTNRKPLTNIQEVPAIYLHQLATYKEVLQRIYPHHTIRCLLLWTQSLEIMEIPQNLLEKSKPSL